jgi:hypothetical protein
MSERQNLDDQKGPKTQATPPGVNRRDLSPAGPDMARSSSDVAGVDHDPDIEGDSPDDSFGESAEVPTADRPAVPGADRRDA